MMNSVLIEHAGMDVSVTIICSWHNRHMVLDVRYFACVLVVVCLLCQQNSLHVNKRVLFVCMCIQSTGHHVSLVFPDI